MTDSSATGVLSEAECRELLAAHNFGRIAVAPAGDVEIFPINYAYVDGGILLRTTPGTKLAALVAHDRVAFEIDERWPDEAWSVAVRGRAHELQSQTEIDAAEAAAAITWTATAKHRFVRIEIDEVSGRRFRRATEEEREDAEAAESTVVD